MSELVFSIQEFLKIVPGIAIFPLSFYLAWKKIGASVSCSITIQLKRTSARRISDVVLTNNKDKPITIFAIQAVIDNDTTFVVEKYDPPFVLKSLETATLNTKPYSTLMVGNSKWEPEFMVPQKIDIYLVTPTKVVKCKMASHPSLERLSSFSHLAQASKINKTFNGVTYNENAKYAITYKDDSIIKTAIVDVSGFICGDWDYRFNMVPLQFMESQESVREFLRHSGAYDAFHIYGVDLLS